MRELGTRFGRDNLGYVWLFLEPALLGGAIGLVHHLSGHALPGGVDVGTFWVIGYIPYYLLRGVLNRGPSAIAANQSLLYHRHVTLLDIMLARNLLEGAATMDRHFRLAPVRENAPLIAAFIDQYYVRAMHCQTRALFAESVVRLLA